MVAVTLELWADPANDGERSCCSPQAVTGARALAHRMGLPHVTLDLREPFRREVVDDFVSEHAAGRTPNPCVRCNGLVRFDAMLELADRLGAARLATGHYARIDDDGDGPLLRAAADPLKDQTYMLARLGADELRRGSGSRSASWTRPRVRELARDAGLSVAEKPESQDLCFLAGTRRRRLPDPPRRRSRARGAGRDRGPPRPPPGQPPRAAGLHGGPAPRHRRGRPRAPVRAAQGRPSGRLLVGPRGSWRPARSH